MKGSSRDLFYLFFSCLIIFEKTNQNRFAKFGTVHGRQYTSVSWIRAYLFWFFLPESRLVAGVGQRFAQLELQVMAAVLTRRSVTQVMAVVLWSLHAGQWPRSWLWSFGPYTQVSDPGHGCGPYSQVRDSCRSCCPSQSLVYKLPYVVVTYLMLYS